MNRLAILLGLVLLCGCKGFTLIYGDPQEPAPAPGPEADPWPAPAPVAAPGPYDHMTQRLSFSPMSSMDLKEGCYAGDFVLGKVQLRIKGAGVDKTVIDGNLVLKTQCEVSNLTVTGDVIFEGNQAKLVDVEFLGRIIDRGLQNRY